jgi:general secretion pathway protein B
MSLILDALRKMELERKARRQSSQEIRSEVLNYRSMAPASEKSRIVPIAAALLLVSAAAFCFLYFKKQEPPKTDSAITLETLKQEPTPAMPQLPAQLPKSETPVKTALPVKVDSSAAPVKQSAKTVPIKQGNGDEGITVSGIAWQDERSLRRAVINGNLVGEGAEIQGARIIEIRENRIRFSRNGDIFEVIHSSGTGR